MRRLFADFVSQAAELLPSLAGAALLLAAGWMLAALLRLIARRLYGRFERTSQGRAVENAVRRWGIQRPLSVLIGAIVFWAVVIFFLTAATEVLGLPVITAWLGGVARLLPRVLVGLLVVLIGLLVGGYAARATTTLATSFGVTYGSLLGRVLQAAFVLVAIVIAADQIGIEVGFLTVLTTAIVASAFGGVALAFGLGAGTAVSNLVASHYLRQTFRPGQRVRIGDVEGTLREITPTSAVLDAVEGRLHVPAKHFGEAVAVQLLGGGE